MNHKKLLMEEFGLSESTLYTERAALGVNWEEMYAIHKKRIALLIWFQEFMSDKPAYVLRDAFGCIYKANSFLSNLYCFRLRVRTKHYDNMVRVKAYIEENGLSKSNRGGDRRSKNWKDKR